jgi:hypothetical protein
MSNFPVKKPFIEFPFQYKPDVDELSEDSTNSDKRTPLSQRSEGYKEELFKAREVDHMSHSDLVIPKPRKTSFNVGMTNSAMAHPTKVNLMPKLFDTK